MIYKRLEQIWQVAASEISVPVEAVNTISMVSGVGLAGKVWQHLSPRGETSTLPEEIISLLSQEGISIRRKDGHLGQVTLSKPTSIHHGLVIGLRYVKGDRTHTEDQFSIEEDQPLMSHYHRWDRLEKKWPEYRGTHKQTNPFII